MCAATSVTVHRLVAGAFGFRTFDSVRTSCLIATLSWSTVRAVRLPGPGTPVYGWPA